MIENPFTRRQFAALTAAAPLLLRGAGKTVPVGLELFSVREALKSDLPGTLKTVASDGYQCVEFYAPYHDWTPEYAAEVRKTLDRLNLRCYSTHNGMGNFDEANIGKTIALNKAIGSRYAIVANAGDPHDLEGWKEIAKKLNSASEKLAGHGLRTGYHNHEPEFIPIDGVRPMEILARDTNHNVALQLDVGTCVKAGSDPVAWINQNPGRIRSLHCKDWSPKEGYRVLFGEGVVPWKKVFAAAQSVGGVEFYLIEQEGSRYSEFETAKLCLEAFRKLQSGTVSST